MKIIVEMEVAGCGDCPMRQSHRGHGENWDWCSHPQSPKGYDNIIKQDYKVPSTHITPEWCPGKQGEKS